MKTLLEIFDKELDNEPNILNVPPRKQRFKDKRFNALYWLWACATPEQVDKVLKHSGSNHDMAFKHGYKGYKCKFQRNWFLYPIYVAGKEWKKHNKA